MLKNLYNSVIDVLRLTLTSDGMGGKTETKSVLHKNLKCRINWKTGGEKIQFDKETYYRDAKVYCSVVDITVKDRVLFNGTEYLIVDVANPDNMDKYLVLNIRLLQS